jgi:hypothetical protein
MEAARGTYQRKREMEEEQFIKTAAGIGIGLFVMLFLFLGAMWYFREHLVREDVHAW